ncbi:uncharacterized protein LOC105017597 [Esox lucius]|uniref:MADF domain-containing protein n=1 Tax=Esox lucius TaxID=8010 RepID=A0A3P8ZGT5_ESOLU|nr:uncharacterized protein LOC105017597 [Esox lucius]
MQLSDKVISAVSDYPELYNITLNSYKDSQRKARAWRAVSLQVELPVDDCRKKWKNLRDTFIRFKRAEQQRKASGEPESHKKTWMHSRRMSFLTPFIQSKGWQGDAAEDLEERGEDLEERGEDLEERGEDLEESDEDLEESGEDEVEKERNGETATKDVDDKSAFIIHEIEGDQADSEGAASPDTALGSNGPGQKRRWQGDGMEDIEDEMFFFSLLPYLRKLPHKKKSAVKLKIHQLLHEALFQ